MRSVMVLSEIALTFQLTKPKQRNNPKVKRLKQSRRVLVMPRISRVKKSRRMNVLHLLEVIVRQRQIRSQLQHKQQPRRMLNLSQVVVVIKQTRALLRVRAR